MDVFCWIRFIHFSTVRAIFNWVSKEFWDCFGIALLRSVIGPENSHRFLNQSDATLKPITTWSSAFSRALACLVVFALSSHWFLKVFSFLYIGLCDNSSFCFTTLNWKALFSSLLNVPWIADGEGGGGGEGGVGLFLNTLNCVFLKIVTMSQNEQLSYARDFHLVIVKVGKGQLPSKDMNQGWIMWFF